METIKIIVSGRPVPKSRPRLGMRGRAAFVYTPEKTKAYQQLVGWEAKKVCKQPLTGPVEVSMKLFSRSRFDLDNVAKSILDGMCGICYVDDVQVEVLHVTKQAVKNKREERAEIEVRPLEKTVIPSQSQ